jgi:hypothetical protein
MTCIQNGIRQSYNAKYKLMVIKYARKTSNSTASREFTVAETNIHRWMQQKQKLKNAKLNLKIFYFPEASTFT